MPCRCPNRDRRRIHWRQKPRPAIACICRVPTGWRPRMWLQTGLRGRRRGLRKLLDRSPRRFPRQYGVCRLPHRPPDADRHRRQLRAAVAHGRQHEPLLAVAAAAVLGSWFRVRDGEGRTARRASSSASSGKKSSSCACSSPTSSAPPRTSRCPTGSSAKRSTAASCSTARRSRGSSGSKSPTCTSSRTSTPSRCFPWTYAGSERVARIICDIANPDGTPFAGCPRSTLKRAIALRRRRRASRCGPGPEAEFFLFQRRADGEPTTETHDSGGYFDLTPVDLGEDVRREIVLALEQMGFHVEAAHHEVAPGPARDRLPLRRRADRRRTT